MPWEPSLVIGTQTVLPICSSYMTMVATISSSCKSERTEESQPIKLSDFRRCEQQNAASIDLDGDTFFDLVVACDGRNQVFYGRATAHSLKI